MEERNAELGRREEMVKEEKRKIVVCGKEIKKRMDEVMKVLGREDKGEELEVIEVAGAVSLVE